MGRIMTLRGDFPSQFGTAATYGVAAGRKVFDYESPDRSRAWKVRRAVVWIQEATGTGGGDARALWQVSLLTDKLQRDFAAISSSGTANRYQRAIGPSDNRSIAWMSQDMLIRDNVNADWIAPHGAINHGTELLCDADRIVTNELYIVSYGLTEGALFTYTASYYIELEEVKLSPSESLFAQLKGVGQNTDPEYPFGFPPAI